MRSGNPWCWVLLGVWSVASTAAAAPVDYTLSADRGRLYVVVRNQGGTLASALGHDHVVVSTGWSGTARWDAVDPASCVIDVTVPVAGLSVDPGDARSWEGFEGETSASDKQTITRNFRSERQLDIERHPRIRFEARACTGDSVLGQLTMRGRTHQVTIPMSVQADGGTIRARGRFSVNHTDFGFEPYKALGGALRNQDRLEFVIDVRGRAR